MTVCAGHGDGLPQLVAKIHRMPEYPWQCLNFLGTGQLAWSATAWLDSDHLAPGMAPKVCSSYSIFLFNLVGRTGFEPVTSSVSGKFRLLCEVCHRRTESNGGPLTCLNILSGSR